MMAILKRITARFSCRCEKEERERKRREQEKRDVEELDALNFALGLKEWGLGEENGSNGKIKRA